jgi:hypothetical protein
MSTFCRIASTSFLHTTPAVVNQRVIDRLPLTNPGRLDLRLDALLLPPKATTLTNGTR